MKTINTSYYTGLILMLLLLFSCNKHEIKDPVNSAPVFTASGELDGESFLLEAGNEGCVMTTEMKEINGVEHYSGKLGTSDFYIEMGIFGGNVDMDQEISPESLEQMLSFAQLGTGPLLVLTKDQFPNAVLIEKIDWYVDGDFKGTNSCEFMEPGKYDVCANVFFTEGKAVSSCNEMIVGYETHGNYTLHSFLSQGGHLKVWVDEATETVESVSWRLNGENLIDNDLLLERFVDGAIQRIEAEVRFTNGASRKKMIVIDGASTGKVIYDFSIHESELNYPAQWDFNVILNMKKDGTMYSSLNTSNQQSAIQITDIVYYGKNASGKNVYKCMATVSANVKSLTGGDPVSLNFNTVFGIEID
jgi:hypothetical protein